MVFFAVFCGVADLFCRFVLQEFFVFMIFVFTPLWCYLFSLLGTFAYRLDVALRHFTQKRATLGKNKGLGLVGWLVFPIKQRKSVTLALPGFCAS